MIARWRTPFTSNVSEHNDDGKHWHDTGLTVNAATTTVPPGGGADELLSLKEHAESFESTGREVNSMLRRILDQHEHQAAGVEGADAANTTGGGDRRRRVPMESINPSVVRALRVHLRQHQVAKEGLRQCYDRQPAAQGFQDQISKSATPVVEEADLPGPPKPPVPSTVEVETDQEAGD